MIHITWLRAGGVLAIALLAGCSTDGAAKHGSGEPQTPSSAVAGAPPTEARSGAEIYAAVITRLAREDDHSLDPAHRVIFVLDGKVVGAGQPLVPVTDPDRPFSAAMKQRVRAAMANGPRATFVARRRDVITGTPPGQVIRDGTLLTLGPIRREGTRAEVAGSYWVNGLDGRWSTYVLTSDRNGWSVIGTTGPIAIS